MSKDKAGIVWVKWSRCTGKERAFKSELELWNELEPNDNYAPYIEKSYYDALEAKLAECVKALESIDVLEANISKAHRKMVSTVLAKVKK